MLLIVSASRNNGNSYCIGIALGNILSIAIKWDIGDNRQLLHQFVQILARRLGWVNSDGIYQVASAMSALDFKAGNNCVFFFFSAFNFYFQYLLSN